VINSLSVNVGNRRLRLFGVCQENEIFREAQRLGSRPQAGRNRVALADVPAAVGEAPSSLAGEEDR